MEYNDIIHGNITINSGFDEFISTWFPLQRLKNVKQLGLAKKVYPNANHTRYQHSLGVVGASQRLLEAANRRHADWYHQIHAETVELMALVHDVGHGPYSHVAEMLLKRNPQWRPGGFDSHEDFSELLIGNPEKWQRLCSDVYEQEASNIDNLLEQMRNRDDVISDIASDVLDLLSFHRDSTIVNFSYPLYERFGKKDTG